MATKKKPGGVQPNAEADGGNDADKREYWDPQDFEVPASFDRFTAGHLFRASKGLQAILNLLSHDDWRRVAVQEGCPPDEVMELLPSGVRSGLFAGAMELARSITHEFDREANKD